MMDGNSQIGGMDLVELLEIYMDLVEKQDTVIFHMASVIRRLAVDLEHAKNAAGLSDFDGCKSADSPPIELVEVMKEYMEAKGD